MITKERLDAEKAVLAKKLPSNIYVFRDMDTSAPYLALAARTNNGKIYTIKIMLAKFPESIPDVVVTKRLNMKDGEPIPGWSHQMHTHSCTENTTEICHYSDAEWTPMVSLYKVYIKCRLWLEMYEEHLKTGYSLDYYLSKK